MHNVRINILGLALIGAALVAILAWLTSGEAQLATLAVAGTLVGGLGGTMTRLSEPDPDPSVPASVVEQILKAVDITAPAELGVASGGGSAWSAWRPNVLILAVIGAIIVAAMTAVLSSEAALVTVAGGFVGGLVSIAAELVKPPPNPSVPASVVVKILERTPA